MRTTITKEIVAVSYDELDESVKQIVLENYRQQLEYDWYEDVFEFFKEDCLGQGLSVEDIQFDIPGTSGGYATFKASLDNFELLLFALECPEKYRRVLLYSWNCCGLSCSATPSPHHGMQYSDVDRRLANPHEYYPHARDHKQNAAYQHAENALDWFEETFDCFCKELSRSLYGSLLREYEYLQSREYIEESITACEIRFDEATGEEVNI